MLQRVILMKCACSIPMHWLMVCSVPQSAARVCCSYRTQLINYLSIFILCFPPPPALLYFKMPQRNSTTWLINQNRPRYSTRRSSFLSRAWKNITQKNEIMVDDLFQISNTHYTCFCDVDSFVFYIANLQMHALCGVWVFAGCTSSGGGRISVSDPSEVWN